jgi:hypothetical protein
VLLVATLLVGGNKEVEGREEEEEEGRGRRRQKKRSISRRGEALL